MSELRESDTLVTVEGYVTDPKFVGYQVVTNYEIIYWQSLVGRDAWMLYLVLRSFCHKGNNSCHPSIKLLMDILALTDRRQLIGREDTAPGKHRVLPGLIDVLQIHELVAAEIKGEGPKKRYIFHVNLTPATLSADQLHQLPKALQRKHTQLLQQIHESVHTFDAVQNKKPTIIKKQEKEGDSVPQIAGDVIKRGGGTVPPPLVPYHGGGGTVPPKQQPINNTHRTTERAREDNNNNSSETPNSNQDNVVVVLVNLGIAERVARRLACHYSQERIAEKIDYLHFLQETDLDKVKKPQGWLRRAIEEDYGPPDGYRTPGERKAEAEREQERQEEFIQQVKATQRRRQQKADASPEEEIWRKLLDQLRLANAGIAELLQGGEFHLADAGRAEICVTSERARALLSEHEGINRVVRTSLTSVLDASVELDITVLAPDAR